MLLAMLLACAINSVHAAAAPASLASIDANARAGGSRRDVAVRIGTALLAREWPAQVQKITADSVDGVLVVALRISGVKFHHPLTRSSFSDEIASLVRGAFAAEHSVSEVDVWASVPLDVGRGVVVSGDLAQPTNRTVFSVTALRGESADSLRARLASGKDVYWDEDWVRTFLKQTD